MNINRHNYESFFLLYVDHELTAAEQKAVEEFVQQNPDLEKELSLLQQSVFPADDPALFAGKEQLFKGESAQPGIHALVEEPLHLLALYGGGRARLGGLQPHHVGHQRRRRHVLDAVDTERGAIEVVEVLRDRLPVPLREQTLSHGSQRDGLGAGHGEHGLQSLPDVAGNLLHCIYDLAFAEAQFQVPLLEPMAKRGKHSLGIAPAAPIPPAPIFETMR